MYSWRWGRFENCIVIDLYPKLNHWFAFGISENPSYIRIDNLAVVHYNTLVEDSKARPLLVPNYNISKWEVTFFTTHIKPLTETDRTRSIEARKNKE